MKEYSREQIAILKLASVEGIGYQHKKAIASLTDSLADLLDHPTSYLTELAKVGGDVCDKLIDLNESFDVDRFFRYLEKMEINILFEGDTEYPAELLAKEKTFLVSVSEKEELTKEQRMHGKV